jgi:hypothetical protein
MCLSRNTGRKSSAPTHSQITLNAWSHVQARRHQNRQGCQLARHSDHGSADHSTFNNAKETYGNEFKCYGSVRAPLKLAWRIIGGNVNGLKPYGDMATLITVAEILHALKAEIIALSETNIEWNKFQLRDNMQKLFTKAFCAARMEYSTTPDEFKTFYNKPGGTARGALGQMVHHVVDSGRDDNGCGRWSYFTYAAKEGKKVTIVSAYRVCKQTNTGDLTSSKQQLGIIYEDKGIRPFLLDWRKQTLIGLHYFVEELKNNGHEVLILMDANQAEEQTFQPQTHNTKIVTKKGFHVDGSIDRSLKRFMHSCGLINVLRQMHESVVPNTHAH